MKRQQNETTEREMEEPKQEMIESDETTVTPA